MLPDLVQAYMYNDAHPVCTIKKVTSVRILAEVITKVQSSKHLFRNCHKIAKNILKIQRYITKNFTSPICHKLIRTFYDLITTATAERSFSTLRRLKTFLPSNMSKPFLNSAMLLHDHKEKTDSIEHVKIASEFVSKNKRRLDFFRNFKK